MVLYSELPKGPLTVGQLLPTQKAKVAPLRLAGRDISCQIGSPEQPLQAVFDFNSYGQEDADRVTALLSAHPDVTRWVDRLENDVCELLVGRKDLLKVCNTVDEVKAQLNSSLKANPRTEELSVRMKVNIRGGRPVKVWDVHGQPTSLPEVMRGRLLAVVAEAKCLWFSGVGFGITWEVSHLKLLESQAAACPL